METKYFEVKIDGKETKILKETIHFTNGLAVVKIKKRVNNIKLNSNDCQEKIYIYSGVINDKYETVIDFSTHKSIDVFRNGKIVVTDISNNLDNKKTECSFLYQYNFKKEEVDLEYITHKYKKLNNNLFIIEDLNHKNVLYNTIEDTSLTFDYFGDYCHNTNTLALAILVIPIGDKQVELECYIDKNGTIKQVSYTNNNGLETVCSPSNFIDLISKIVFEKNKLSFSNENNKDQKSKIFKYPVL